MKWTAKKIALVIISLQTLVFASILSWTFTSSRDFILGMVRSQLAVSPDSAIFDIWKSPPIHPTMKIHIFNITNLEDWISGITANEI